MYVILHADEESVRRNGGKAAVETFVVGQEIEKGERLQWVVEGGKYKGTFLLPDDGGSSNGLLISEVGSLSTMNVVFFSFLLSSDVSRLSSPDSNSKTTTSSASKRWTSCSPQTKSRN